MLDPFPQYDVQCSQDIGMRYEYPVKPVCKENLFRIGHGLYNLLIDLAHVHL